MVVKLLMILVLSIIASVLGRRAGVTPVVKEFLRHLGRRSDAVSKNS